MTIKQFICDTDLERSLLLGYYGGGNYGDELLLEVLQNLFVNKNVQHITIAYQHSKNFQVMHNNFGYGLVNIKDRMALLRSAMQNRNIIIGGGGLWGVDMNMNTFVMSFFLFIARYFMRKKVYLVGVGYYSSTNRMGRIGAFFAGKAANKILVRDTESLQNFQKINKCTEQDVDIAFYTDEVDFATYDQGVRELESLVPVTDKTLFIALRRFRHANDFSASIGQLLRYYPDRPIILALMELKNVDTESAGQIGKWKKNYPNVRVLDVPFNPLALFAYFHKYHERLAVIAPQFHLILTAHLTKVPFLPVVYDNKVGQLLSSLGISEDDQIPISGLTADDADDFAKRFFGD